MNDDTNKIVASNLTAAAVELMSRRNIAAHRQPHWHSTRDEVASLYHYYLALARAGGPKGESSPSQNEDQPGGA